MGQGERRGGGLDAARPTTTYHSRMVSSLGAMRPLDGLHAAWELTSPAQVLNLAKCYSCMYAPVPPGPWAVALAAHPEEGTALARTHVLMYTPPQIYSKCVHMPGCSLLSSQHTPIIVPVRTEPSSYSGLQNGIDNYGFQDGDLIPEICRCFFGLVSSILVLADAYGPVNFHFSG